MPFVMEGRKRVNTTALYKYGGLLATLTKLMENPRPCDPNNINSQRTSANERADDICYELQDKG